MAAAHRGHHQGRPALREARATATRSSAWSACNDTDVVVAATRAGHVLHCKADEIASSRARAAASPCSRPTTTTRVIGFVAGVKATTLVIETARAGKKFTLARRSQTGHRRAAARATSCMKRATFKVVPGRSPSRAARVCAEGGRSELRWLKRSTPRTTSRSSRASSRCASARACTSAAPAAGYHHLLWEVVDNSIDEVINKPRDQGRGHAARRRQERTVDDNGRGIPVDIMREVQEAGARGHLHHAALGRQVRARRELRGVGRPARRRRGGGQRAVERADRRQVKRDRAPRDAFARGVPSGKLKKLGPAPAAPARG
jgi:hypothetical protein